jgi:hypothetical protein
MEDDSCMKCKEEGGAIFVQENGTKQVASGEKGGEQRSKEAKKQRSKEAKKQRRGYDLPGCQCLEIGAGERT